jgi:hypothetical protein
MDEPTQRRSRSQGIGVLFVIDLPTISELLSFMF